MAHITREEFDRAVVSLVDHFGVDRMRDKLAGLGAFRSRRGLNSPASLGERLFRLSGGLRLDVSATYAFSALWGELLAERLGDDGERTIDELADSVNACLGDGDRIVEGKERELDQALGAYHAALAEKVGNEIASLDMLLKSVPDVAARLREPTTTESTSSADSPST
jgi:hypothetical protein